MGSTELCQDAKGAAAPSGALLKGALLAWVLGIQRGKAGTSSGSASGGNMFMWPGLFWPELSDLAFGTWPVAGRSSKPEPGVCAEAWRPCACPLRTALTTSIAWTAPGVVPLSDFSELKPRARVCRAGPSPRTSTGLGLEPPVLGGRGNTACFVPPWAFIY